MRTPNTSCVICGKPLYRRPSDQAKARFSACRLCFDEAKGKFGMTAAQEEGLSRGRRKGNGGRSGRPHKVSSRKKASESHKRWCAENPHKVAARGEKTRGENHYLWKGGSANFNKSVRQMTENINWAKAVKDRDTCCQRCGSTSRLEAHHVETLEELMVRLDLRTRGDCRAHSKIIWAMSNGITLCRHCHFRHHNRGFSMKIDQSTFEKMPDHIRQMFVQLPDPVVAMFPASNGSGPARKLKRSAKPDQEGWGMNTTGADEADLRDAGKGSAARFFHQFTTDADPLFYHPSNVSGGPIRYSSKAGKLDRAGSKHPTVKPIALMQYLIRHITPPGGVVLDPFAGSGTTAEAAQREGFDCILMEAEQEYVDFLNTRFSLNDDDLLGGSAQSTKYTIDPDLEDIL